MNVKPFLGEYSLVSSDGRCAQNVKVVAACDGLKVMTVSAEGKLSENLAMCSIDKGADRDLSRNSGGHAIFPSLDYSKVVVTSHSKENKIVKVENETSVSIIVFSSKSTTTVQMESENQMLISNTLVTDASETESFCSYMRQ